MTFPEKMSKVGRFTINHAIFSKDHYIFCDKDGSDVLVELGISSGNKSNSSIRAVCGVLIKSFCPEEDSEAMMKRSPKDGA